MTLSPTQQAAIATLARVLQPGLSELGKQTAARARGLCDWAERKYYIETGYPIHLEPHQRVLLEYMLDEQNDFQNLIYSSIKKSGKTAITGMVARYVTEHWGPKAEVYCMANDLEQARGRIYQAAIESITDDPNYNKARRELPGEWRIIERQAHHLPTGGIMRAVSMDYKGEAGSNPSATFWSELWGYTSEAARRMWDELTPPPTRSRSIRWVETYAGFEDEATLLNELYKLGKEGRRLTHDDIDWPFPDQPPVWVNPVARMCMYWDTDEVARRMPWQTPEYYAAQAAMLRPQAFERLHLNHWTSSVSTFIPIEWWDACYDSTLPPLDATTPVVMGVDAAVSNDCAAVVGVTRHPKRPQDPAIRFSRIWTPPSGGKIDFKEIDAYIRTTTKNHNIVELTYDPYQMHKLATDLVADNVVWCRPFSQNQAREIADKQFFDLIRDRRVAHVGLPEMRDHIRNAAAKTAVNEDTRLRIVKKTNSGKIDSAVAASMAISECLRLLL